jgi:hypothetical protein
MFVLRGVRKIISVVGWILRLGGLAGGIRNVYQVILYLASYGFALTVASALSAALNFVSQISQISLWFRVPCFIGVFLLVLAVVGVVIDYGLRHILSHQRRKVSDNTLSEAAREWYATPKKPEVGKTFRNEQVLLDGRSFIQCKFINVTFVYKGEKPFDLRPGNEIQGNHNITADSPQLQGLVKLMHQLGYIKPEIKMVQGRLTLVETRRIRP